MSSWSFFAYSAYPFKSVEGSDIAKVGVRTWKRPCVNIYVNIDHKKFIAAKGIHWHSHQHTKLYTSYESMLLAQTARKVQQKQIFPAMITLEYFRSFLLVSVCGIIRPGVTTGVPALPGHGVQWNSVPREHGSSQGAARAPGGFHSSRRGGRSVTPTGMTGPVFTRLSSGFHHVSLGTSWSCQALEYEPAGDDVEC